VTVLLPPFSLRVGRVKGIYEAKETPLLYKKLFSTFCVELSRVGEFSLPNLIFEPYQHPHSHQNVTINSQHRDISGRPSTH